VSGWSAFAAHLVLATLIASAVVVVAVRRQLRDPVNGDVLAPLFPWLEERRDYASAVSIARYARERPVAWGILVFASAPTVAALVVGVLGSDESDLGSIVGQLAPIGDGTSTGAALTTYALIVAVFVAVCAVYLREVARSDQVPALLRGRSRGRVWARLGGGMFTDEGGTLEELGWRALSLPALVAATGSLWWATMIVSISWWAWHLPREVPGLLLTRDVAAFVRAQAPFVLLCLALSTLMTAAWHHTHSVWPAIMIHGGSNVWSKAIGGPMWTRTGRDVRMLVVVTLAVVVAAVAAA
jgi:membrane protease YdiL (CAAX protease family)